MEFRWNGRGRGTVGLLQSYNIPHCGIIAANSLERPTMNNLTQLKIRKPRGTRATAASFASAVAVAFVGVLSIAGCKDISQPYKMVDELMTDPLPFKGKPMKIHGWVEPGSIKEVVVAQEMHRSFVLQKDGKKIFITNIGPKPDTFRDQSEVVASGILVEKNGEYSFEASELQAKCPSKYEGAQANKDLLNDPNSGPQYK
jgi:cytochrome c-type biogenesis protein CcmE